jgi:hypothetical protein
VKPEKRFWSRSRRIDEGVADQFRVNSPKNNDAEIIVPIELESVSPSENSPQLL